MAQLHKLVVLAAWCTAFAPGARAETLVEDNVESRVVVALQGDTASVQKRLPPELEVLPVPAGPAKDANLLVVFYDRLHQQDGAGKPTSAATMRFAVVVASVKHKATGKPAFAVLRVFITNPEQVPGFYKNGVLASVKRQHLVDGQGLEPGSVKDEWEVNSEKGSIHLRLEFTRAVPTRSQRELQIVSAADTARLRIYRTDELADVIRSAPAKMDRARKLEFHAKISDMGDLFGPSTQVVAAVVNPTFLRKVFLPDVPPAALR